MGCLWGCPFSCLVFPTCATEGAALMALEKFRLAKAEFVRVCKLKPSDRDARAKLDECEKAIRRKVCAEWLRRPLPLLKASAIAAPPPRD